MENDIEYDYIVIGSGAGGGTVAANLAKSGFTVALIEAGKDCSDNPHSQVPVFHSLSTEDDALSWDYFVKHYTRDDRQKGDSKYDTNKEGVFYPRAGTLGGCTAHNAMIFVYPHNRDWDEIASITGDKSWRSDNMRKYFIKIERCRYGVLHRLIRYVNYLLPAYNPKRRGYHGWLQTSMAQPTLLLHDKSLIKIVYEAVEQAAEEHVGNVFKQFDDGLDPNDWEDAKNNSEGVTLFPISTCGGKRNGTREYLKSIKSQYPKNLTFYTDTLATRILVDDNKNAVGVEYLQGEHLYEADPNAKLSENKGAPGKIKARKEIIVAAGAFNTPQLLKLSGIGPKEELLKYGIKVIADLPGVGENLQDRYEVGIVSKIRKDFQLLKGADFKSTDDDPYYKEWHTGKGLYTSNGSVIGIIKRSDSQKKEPDLFIFGLPGFFKGYFRGYSNQHIKDKDYFTWAVLKGHTNNKSGRVLLKSSDPRETPDINFHYFDDDPGNHPWQEDLDAVLKGVEFVRRMNSDQGLNNVIEEEVVPGKSIDNSEKLKDFIKKEAWGHHASCSCKIGADDDKMAVLDSNFKVRGVNKLRVVDASVFPSIPGLFIVSSVYMIGEKASEVILNDVKKR